MLTPRGDEGQTGLIVSSSRSREHIDFSHTPLSTHRPLSLPSFSPKDPSYFSFLSLSPLVLPLFDLLLHPSHSRCTASVFITVCGLASVENGPDPHSCHESESGFDLYNSVAVKHSCKGTYYLLPFLMLHSHRMQHCAVCIAEAFVQESHSSQVFVRKNCFGFCSLKSSMNKSLTN